MTTALVVDDEKDIVSLIKYHLQRENMKVIEAYNGKDAVDLAKKYIPDLIILDLMLPLLDGLEVCKILRRDPITSRVPLIMLTAKSEEIDKVVGFELGADDYITKPFGIKELIARVKALLRRSYRTVEGEIINIGKLKVDLARYEITLNGKPVELTTKEFELLKALIKAKGRVLNREYLLENVWGYDNALEIESRTVDVHVNRIREKIGSESSRIITVKGVGYKLKLDD